MNRITILFLILVLVMPGMAMGDSGALPVVKASPVETFFHDHTDFTQGLVWLDGQIYESTGHYGTSTIKVLEPETGRAIKERVLDRDRFGEGLAHWQGRLIQLTWKSGVGYEYEPSELKRIGMFRFEPEGWGLAATDTGLVMSRGDHVLTFLDPEDYHPVGTLAVHEGDSPVRWLNELEFVDGYLLCNLYGQDRVAVVDLDDGQVTGWLDLSPLRKLVDEQAGVANGLAYDPDRNRLFVTGKNWDKMFVLDYESIRTSLGLPLP